MSDPALGLAMLGLIVIAIMMGFPTAFTLMGLGMLFGFVAFWDPAQPWYANHAFDLMVQRAYGVMTNDTLLSIPLFVFMGYVMERAALVDRMFHSVQLAFRRVPASLAVTTLLVCAFWGIASGIVGAVVVLMGVIAMRPMLHAGYDVRLASGAITAGGTLGILIPPSVMLIVYAAVAGQSIVKLYAAAMLPGFFLTFLYLAYILGWAILNPRIAPQLPPDQYRVAVPEWLQHLERGKAGRLGWALLAAAVWPSLLRGARAPDGQPVGYGLIVKSLVTAMVPAVLAVATFGATWWYVVVYNAPTAAVASVRTPAASPPRAPGGSPGNPVQPPRGRRISARRRRDHRNEGRRRRSHKSSAPHPSSLKSWDPRRTDPRRSGRRPRNPRLPTRRPSRWALHWRRRPPRRRRTRFPGTSTRGSGGARRCRRFCSRSTTGAWTASSSRS